MISWFKQLDDLLRGRRTAPGQLASGEIALSLRRFVPLTVFLAVTYGFFMGWYALLSGDSSRYMQAVACMVKLPALFLLTLVVTFPSLYVFNALVGCRLSFTATLRLLVGAIAVNVTLAASLGPILGFFTVSTTSYPFMIILNVVLLGIAGVVGLSFLLHTLRRLSIWPILSKPPAVPPVWDIGNDSTHDEPLPAREPGALDELPVDIPEESLGQARFIFQIWVVIYGLVGAQMGWILRPFIGSPDKCFEWFREGRQGDFFTAVIRQLGVLLGSN